jgi:hypothetical protein
VRFLEAAMLRLSLDARWVYLIMACIRSVSYSVVVNGNPVGLFSPSRGIRQGDPISPYLFLICAEVFSSLLLKAEKRGVITGVPTSPRGPSLNHLFFADDSLLFCKANSVEWRRLLKILEIYEAGSGQKLNLSKTSIFFFSVGILLWSVNRRFCSNLDWWNLLGLNPIWAFPLLLESLNIWLSRILLKE